VGGYAGVFKTYDEVLNEPQVKAIEMVQEIEHPVREALNLSVSVETGKDTCRHQEPAPTLGQHTDEILRELKYSSEDIGVLKGRRQLFDWYFDVFPCIKKRSLDENPWEG